jgi:hypothetical protein
MKWLNNSFFLNFRKEYWHGCGLVKIRFLSLTTCSLHRFLRFGGFLFLQKSLLTNSFLSFQPLDSGGPRLFEEAWRQVGHRLSVIFQVQTCNVRFQACWDLGAPFPEHWVMCGHWLYVPSASNSLHSDQRSNSVFKLECTSNRSWCLNHGCRSW